MSPLTQSLSSLFSGPRERRGRPVPGALRPAPGRLQDQRRERHARVHGVRGAGSQPAQIYHQKQLPGNPAPERQDHHEAGRQMDLVVAVM